jgi:hypothetical protein
LTKNAQINFFNKVTALLHCGLYLILRINIGSDQNAWASIYKVWTRIHRGISQVICPNSGLARVGGI